MWMRRAGNVACISEVINARNVLIGKSERKSHSEDLSVDVTIMLERILEE